jgi:hypothetical protein
VLIVAPTASYYESIKLEPSPAPFSTCILKPCFINLDAASGVTDTLFSPSKTSFGTPFDNYLTYF